MENKMKAADNPALANNLVEKALSTPTPVDGPKVTPPSDTTVELPGGLILPTGEVLRTAEVRELTGRDEEIISRAANPGKALATLIDRATVSIGDNPADEKSLYGVFAGDRDALLLGIYKATFGNSADVPAFCTGCSDVKLVSVDIDEDIETVKLEDPISEAVFTVEGKSGDIMVRLPNGRVQKDLIDNSDKTQAELSTILLEKTVISIDGKDVFSKSQVQNMNVADRRLVLEEIDKRVPGPKLQDLSVECPDCGGKVGVPINLGTLFRL